MRILYLLILTTFICALNAQNQFKSATSCGECHEEIFQMWSVSRHALSTPQTDPLFRGMYEWAIQDSEGKLEQKCIICHSPHATVFNSIDREAVFNRDGINCQYCHGAKAINDFHSAKDIIVDLDTIYSHQPDLKNEAHPSAHREYFAKSELCLPCHAEMKNPEDIAVCATGEEWRAYSQQTGKQCQHCHMPVRDGIRSHRFPGTHLDDLLKDAVKINLEFFRDKGEVAVTLTNTGGGHALPTGTPLRMVYLKLRAQDEQGEVIWENWKENPIAEDKTALFMKILGDAQGNGPVPPWKATQILFERRLLPNQPETILYLLPELPIASLSAQVFYRLAPPPILKRLGISDPHFTEPRLLAEETLKKAE